MSIKGRLKKLEHIIGPPPDGVPRTVSLDHKDYIYWVDVCLGSAADPAAVEGAGDGLGLARVSGFPRARK